MTAFELSKTLTALESTPEALNALLSKLPDSWMDFSEDPEAWSPRSVLIHFIHNEQANWMTRARVILEDGGERAFPPFNQMPDPANQPSGSTAELLELFSDLRKQNLGEIREFNIQEGDLERTGEHPSLGTVTLQQLLSTWLVHDYNHLHQIAKTLAKHYGEAVGPWTVHLAILDL